MAKKITRSLSSEEKKSFLSILKLRFEKNMNRHKSLDWTKLQERLEANKDALFTLNAMELTGGEPDVVDYDNKTGEYVFFDCSYVMIETH